MSIDFSFDEPTQIWWQLALSSITAVIVARSKHSFLANLRNKVGQIRKIYNEQFLTKPGCLETN